MINFSVKHIQRADPNAPAQQELIPDINVEELPKLDAAFQATALAKPNFKTQAITVPNSETSRGMNRNHSEVEMPTAEQQFAAQLGAKPA